MFAIFTSVVTASIAGDCQIVSSAWTAMGGNNSIAPNASDCCSGTGITCSAESVTKIVWPRQNLVGLIPDALGSLGNLDTLRLQDNDLSGAIPSTFGNLTNLEYLHLSENRLTGSIPSNLANLAKLRELSLWRNQLSGSLPPAIGYLKNLTVLYININPGRNN